MIRLYFAILIISLNVGVTFQICGQSKSDYTLNYYLDKRDSYSAYNFNVEFELKWFNREDTFRYNAFVELVRIEDDSLFGGLIYIELDSLIFAYDRQQLIRVDKLNSSAETGNPIVHPKLWIASTWVNDFVEYGFLKRNQGFRTVLENPDIRTVVTDTMIGEWPCKGFYFHMPDEGDFTDQFAFVAIDTINYMLRRRVTSIWFQENQQYQSWTFHNPKYGQQTSIARLDNDFLSHYTLKEEYNPIPKDTSLKYSIDYSTLQGKILGQEKPIALKDISADVIILDFWYSSCYPCIKSIPEVNKLYERFKDKNVKVYGVNIIDDESTNKSRIEKYMRNNPMQYETIMANGKTFSSWVQNGYPTLLILDKNFKLIQDHTGYSEHMADELSAVITKYLENK